MNDRSRSPGGLLVPVLRSPLAWAIPSGLVLPGAPSTAGIPGQGAVSEARAWLGNVLGIYLPAWEYLGPFEAARGRSYDCHAWTRVLLARFSAEEYLCQLAVLNHAATSEELTSPFAERFLGRIAADAAEAVRRAMAGGIDGFPRWFLARQLVLRAMRQVLLPPEAGREAAPDPALDASLEGIDLETAAVLLVHLAGDALRWQQQPDEALFCGLTESLAMEMNANSLFNDRDDDGDLLARYRMLWLDYGVRLKRYHPRLPPADMLREAAGIGLDEMITLAFAYWTHLHRCGPGDPVPASIMVAPAMRIPRADVETFLGCFSSTPAALADELRQCPQPWQMRPLQARPLLRLGDDVVVLDERYLIERVTRGLYWLVHDHEKEAHGDKARGAWTQVWGEMVETRVEDQLRQMAPALLGGGRAFFTEEELQAAFPRTMNCDAGIDYGGDVVLAEVVSGTVKVQTRELADSGSFMQDAERIVLHKARQLYVTAACLLRRPQPEKSPVRVPPTRIFPIVVISGQFPLNPITSRFISEQLTAEGHRPDGTIQPLTVMDLEELESCHALHQRKGHTLPQLLDAWRASPYRDAAFRNYLAHEIGGQEIGRPADVQDALTDSFKAIHYLLGAPGAWTPPESFQAGREP